MQPLSRKFVALTGVVLFELVSVVVAHSHDEDMIMDIGESATPMQTFASLKSSVNATVLAKPGTYFQYGPHSALLTAHIFLMTISWVFILPIGTPLLRNSDPPLC